MGKIMNAVITSARLHLEESYNFLTIDIVVDREDGFSQVFGGASLASPNWEKATPDYTGTYILGLLKITDCKDLEAMKGKAVKIDVDTTSDIIVGVGHIIKNEWFYPAKEFDRLRTEFETKERENGK